MSNLDNQMILESKKHTDAGQNPNSLAAAPEIDALLLERLKEGDVTAFEQIYYRWRAPIKNFLVKLTRSEADAEDITQDVFANLWNTHESMDSSKSLKRYIFVSARNSAYRLYYRRNLQQSYLTSGSADEFDVSADSHDLLVATEIKLLTEFAIERMPARQREVYLCHYRDNMSNAEIAQKLDMSQESVRKHMQNAKESLRQAVSMAVVLFF